LPELHLPIKRLTYKYRLYYSSGLPHQDVLGAIMDDPCITKNFLRITKDVLGFVMDVLGFIMGTLGIIVDVPCPFIHPLLK
jgi:hypothetical protein